MQKPENITCAYIDFDGFFASVEEQVRPALRGRPIGIIPSNTEYTVCIAANAKAKQFGVKTGTSVKDAKKLCPEIALVKQSPDLYRRAHHALLNIIDHHLPIDAVCSIDELSGQLDQHMIDDPYSLSHAIKQDIAKEIGPHITASIGFGPNRMIAKIACKLDKPDGITIIDPKTMPGRLLTLFFDDIPGIGSNMETRLMAAGIFTVKDLWNSSPKELRKIWKSVAGERLWYALHGYLISSALTKRSMFGHSRVLPPGYRSVENAYECSRLLASKAAFRMRRSGYAATKVFLGLSGKKSRFSATYPIPHVYDSVACLSGVETLWDKARSNIEAGAEFIRCSVGFMDLRPINERQLDMLLQDDETRKKWEKTTKAMDHLNYKYGRLLVTVGPTSQPPDGYAGGKIAFSHLPDEEDFWQ